MIIGEDYSMAAEHPSGCYATPGVSVLLSLSNLPFPHLGNDDNTYTARESTNMDGIPTGHKAVDLLLI